MKEIKIYECADGSRFDKKTDAKRYEELCENVSFVMQNLNNRPSERERVKQDMSIVRSVFQSVMKNAADYFPEYSSGLKEALERGGYIGHYKRIFLDSEALCLKRALYRFDCIKDGYEYSQPGYAVYADHYVNDRLSDEIQFR